MIKNKINRNLTYLSLAMLFFLSAGCAYSAEQRLSSPDGTIDVVISDDQGLHYRVEIDGKVVLTKSPLGLEFKDGVTLGPSAIIRKALTSRREGQWENRFGQRRFVQDNWRQLHLTLKPLFRFH